MDLPDLLIDNNRIRLTPAEFQCAVCPLCAPASPARLSSCNRNCGPVTPRTLQPSHPPAPCLPATGPHLAVGQLRFYFAPAPDRWSAHSRLPCASTTYSVTSAARSASWFREVRSVDRPVGSIGKIPYRRIYRLCLPPGMKIERSRVFRYRSRDICNRHAHANAAVYTLTAISIWSRSFDESLSIDDHHSPRRSRVLASGWALAAVATARIEATWASPARWKVRVKTGLQHLRHRPRHQGQTREE